MCIRDRIAGDSNAAAHLLEFDSVHGRWVKDIKAKEEEIIIDEKKLTYTSFKITLMFLGKNLL